MTFKEIEKNRFHIFDIKKKDFVDYHSNAHRVYQYLKDKVHEEYLLHVAGRIDVIKADVFLQEYENYIKETIVVTEEPYVCYKVALAGQSSYFSHEGYSEYYNRLKLREEGKIKREDVYGYEQALAHIEEMRKSVYDGKLHHAESIFEIRIETTVVSKIFMPPKKQ